jgi:hypothetical protein
MSVFFNGERFSSIVKSFLRGEVLRPSRGEVPNEEADDIRDFGVTCWVLRLIINVFNGEDFPALSGEETNGARAFFSHTLEGEPLKI